MSAPPRSAREVCSRRESAQVADLVKADRLNRLNDVCWEVAEERAQRLGNRTHEARPWAPSTACARKHG